MGLEIVIDRLRGYVIEPTIKLLIIWWVKDLRNCLRLFLNVILYIIKYVLTKFMSNVMSQAQAILSIVLKMVAAIKKPETVTIVLVKPE